MAIVIADYVPLLELSTNMGVLMFNYNTIDINEMIQAIDACLTQTNDTDDPWLHSRLFMAHDLLSTIKDQ